VSTQVNLYEAKTQLSSLVERAAKGEEIIIAKSGQPVARLIALAAQKPEAIPPRIPFGEDLLGIKFLSDDWEKDLPLEMFEGSDDEKLFREEVAK